MSLIKTALGIGLAGLFVSGCATQTGRFEWGSYESSLYVYAKAPDKRPQYRASLETAVARGRETSRMAPGLLAELGYVHLEDGDTAGAIPLFEEEAATFPESRPFMTRLIERAKKAEKPTPAASVGPTPPAAAEAVKVKS